METKAFGIHQSTYDAVFQHPISRNLQWRDVRSMLSACSDTTDEHSGNVKFTRNGQTLTVHPPLRKEFSDVHELMQIRHFLEKSNTPLKAAVGEGTQLLVVIDHREARIYKTDLHGTVPQRVTLLDPDGSHRYLHNVQDDSNGQRKPEPKAFYDGVVKSLKGADSILIFGSSTGASSAMIHLTAELTERHPQIASRVIGTVVVDDHHMTENQILEKARKFYATRPPVAAHS